MPLLQPRRGRHHAAPVKSWSSSLKTLVLTLVWLLSTSSCNGDEQSLRDAIRSGDLSAVQSLLDSGADITSEAGTKYTVLHYAVFGDHADIARYLIEQGAEVNARNPYGATPLHQAQSAAMARLLIDSGADVNAWSEINATPLHSAITNNQVEVVTVLLTHRAKLESEDASGSKPLHYAAGKGRFEAAQILVAAGADVNAVNDYGFTPLHWSAGNGHRELTVLLLARGAEPALVTHRGLTPAQRADQRGHADIADLIRQHRAGE